MGVEIWVLEAGVNLFLGVYSRDETVLSGEGGGGEEIFPWGVLRFREEIKDVG
jgi:hypothetical protein